MDGRALCRSFFKNIFLLLKKLRFEKFETLELENSYELPYTDHPDLVIIKTDLLHLSPFSLLTYFKAYPRHDVTSPFHTSVCISKKHSHFLT